MHFFLLRFVVIFFVLFRFVVPEEVSVARKSRYSYERTSGAGAHIYVVNVCENMRSNDRDWQTHSEIRVPWNQWKALRGKTHSVRV